MGNYYSLYTLQLSYQAKFCLDYPDIYIFWNFKMYCKM